MALLADYITLFYVETVDPATCIIHNSSTAISSYPNLVMGIAPEIACGIDGDISDYISRLPFPLFKAPN